MFEVGEFIVHPGQGVCKVAEVVEGEKAVYRLLPINQRHHMLITFPMANEARLRPVLTHDEAVDLIDAYPSIEVDDYRCKSNALEEEHFKDKIRNGTCQDTVRIAKTFRSRIHDVRARNKKPPVAYERILKQATERSVSELAVALDVTQDEVKDIFASRKLDLFGEN